MPTIAWSEVEAKPEYQALSPQEKRKAQEQYFSREVSGKLPPTERAKAWAQFTSQYPVSTPKVEPKPSLWSEPFRVATQLVGGAVLAPIDAVRKSAKGLYYGGKLGLHTLGAPVDAPIAEDFEIKRLTSEYLPESRTMNALGAGIGRGAQSVVSGLQSMGMDKETAEGLVSATLEAGGDIFALLGGPKALTASGNALKGATRIVASPKQSLNALATGAKAAPRAAWETVKALPETVPAAVKTIPQAVKNLNPRQVLRQSAEDWLQLPGDVKSGFRSVREATFGTPESRIGMAISNAEDPALAAQVREAADRAGVSTIPAQESGITGALQPKQEGMGKELAGVVKRQQAEINAAAERVLGPDTIPDRDVALRPVQETQDVLRAAEPVAQAETQAAQARSAAEQAVEAAKRPLEQGGQAIQRRALVSEAKDAAEGARLYAVGNDLNPALPQVAHDQMVAAVDSVADVVSSLGHQTPALDKFQSRVATGPGETGVFSLKDLNEGRSELQRLARAAKDPVDKQRLWQAVTGFSKVEDSLIDDMSEAVRAMAGPERQAFQTRLAALKDARDFWRDTYIPRWGRESPGEKLLTGPGVWKHQYRERAGVGPAETEIPRMVEEGRFDLPAERYAEHFAPPVTNTTRPARVAKQEFDRLFADDLPGAKAELTDALRASAYKAYQLKGLDGVREWYKQRGPALDAYGLRSEFSNAEQIIAAEKAASEGVKTATKAAAEAERAFKSTNVAKLLDQQTSDDLAKALVGRPETVRALLQHPGVSQNEVRTVVSSMIRKDVADVDLTTYAGIKRAADDAQRMYERVVSTSKNGQVLYTPEQVRGAKDLRDLFRKMEEAGLKLEGIRVEAPRGPWSVVSRLAGLLFEKVGLGWPGYFLGKEVSGMVETILHGAESKAAQRALLDPAYKARIQQLYREAASAKPRPSVLRSLAKTITGSGVPQAVQERTNP